MQTPIRNRVSGRAVATAMAFGLAASQAAAQGGYVHENGIGPDPDNDTNPATVTGVVSISGGAADSHDDPPYSVINFEKLNGHGDVIVDSYKDDFGVTFLPEVTRQICAGMQHFRYDSACTYAAAPSGRYAAVYLDYLNRPLIVKFDRPVCVVTMAIYPTGGKQGEEFEVTVKGKNASDGQLETVSTTFAWRKETVRWKQMIGAYFLEDPATEIAISMRSKDKGESKKVLRYLIDDVAVVEDECEAVVSELRARAGEE